MPKWTKESAVSQLALLIDETDSLTGVRRYRCLRSLKPLDLVAVTFLTLVLHEILPRHDGYATRQAQIFRLADEPLEVTALAWDDDHGHVG